MEGYYLTSTDEELAVALRGGIKEAFDQIYERHWKKLLNETHRRLRDMEQSEEIVQDVFIDLWHKREQKDIQSLYPYLLTSVRNHVFMLYRKRKNLPFFEEPLEDVALSHLQADSFVIEKDLKSCIQFWQKMQPEKRAEIFRLRHEEGYSTREISEILGISQKTVQNQLIKSLKSLKSFLTRFMIFMNLM